MLLRNMPSSPLYSCLSSMSSPQRNSTRFSLNRTCLEFLTRRDLRSVFSDFYRRCDNTEASLRLGHGLGKNRFGTDWAGMFGVGSAFAHIVSQPCRLPCRILEPRLSRLVSKGVSISFFEYQRLLKIVS